MTDVWINPMGTDGIEFVEFAAPEPVRLDKLFRSIGFVPVACHRAKDVTLYRQGSINLILNSEPASFAQSFARVHGASVCAVAFRVKNARAAAERAQRLGAELVSIAAGPMELNIPAIRGIGGSLIYLVDRYEGLTIYDIDFVPIAGAEQRPIGIGLGGVGHFSHTVHRGRRTVWADFYARLFNFHDVGDCMASPCGNIHIQIREPRGSADACEGFLDAYHGEGIQEVALTASDISAVAEQLRARQMTVAEAAPDEPLTIPTGDALGPASLTLIQQAS